jgi:hypothetical protein
MVTKAIKYTILEIICSLQNQYSHNIDYDSTHSCQVYLPSKK